MFRTDDPVADYDSYDDYNYKQRLKLPVCGWCGEHCDSDYAYQIEGDIVCDDCIDGCRTPIEILMEVGNDE